jgi:hypothetical protein
VVNQPAVSAGKVDHDIFQVSFGHGVLSILPMSRPMQSTQILRQ